MKWCAGSMPLRGPGSPGFAPQCRWGSPHPVKRATFLGRRPGDGTVSSAQATPHARTRNGDPPMTDVALPTELEPGSLVDEFRIDAVAGRGGMGVVYRATQVGLDRPVALKVIAPGLANDETFRERFARESALAGAIEHPNVIPVYGAGEADGRLFLAMRWVEGSDLRALVERDGQLEPARAVAVVAAVADALDAAHAPRPRPPRRQAREHPRRPTARLPRRLRPRARRTPTTATAASRRPASSSGRSSTSRPSRSSAARRRAAPTSTASAASSTSPSPARPRSGRDSDYEMMTAHLRGAAARRRARRRHPRRARRRRRPRTGEGPGRPLRDRRRPRDRRDVRALQLAEPVRGAGAREAERRRRPRRAAAAARSPRSPAPRSSPPPRARSP